MTESNLYSIIALIGSALVFIGLLSRYLLDRREESGVKIGLTFLILPGAALTAIGGFFSFGLTYLV